MKKFLILTTLPVLLASCAGAPVETVVDETPEIEVMEEKGAVSTFEHAELGFSLEFPEAWSEYVFTEEELGWGEFGTTNSIYFGLPTWEQMFNVTVFTSEQWDQIQDDQINNNIPIAATPVLFTDGKVYTWSRGHDSHEDLLEEAKMIEDIVQTMLPV